MDLSYISGVESLLYNWTAVISGTIPLKKIKFTSELQHAISNLKLLQKSFKKLGVHKVRVGLV